MRGAALVPWKGAGWEFHWTEVARGASAAERFGESRAGVSVVDGAFFGELFITGCVSVVGHRLTSSASSWGAFMHAGGGWRGLVCTPFGDVLGAIGYRQPRVASMGVGFLLVLDEGLSFLVVLWGRAIAGLRDSSIRCEALASYSFQWDVMCLCVLGRTQVR